MDKPYECITSFQNGIEVGDRKGLVRCKDCKHRGDRNKCIVAFVAEKQGIPYFFYDNRGEWFCADGERRDDQ